MASPLEIQSEPSSLDDQAVICIEASQTSPRRFLDQDHLQQESNFPSAAVDNSEDTLAGVGAATSQTLPRDVLDDAEIHLDMSRSCNPQGRREHDEAYVCNGTSQTSFQRFLRDDEILQQSSFSCDPERGQEQEESIVCTRTPKMSRRGLPAERNICQQSSFSENAERREGAYCDVGGNDVSGHGGDSEFPAVDKKGVVSRDLQTDDQKILATPREGHSLDFSRGVLLKPDEEGLQTRSAHTHNADTHTSYYVPESLDMEGSALPASKYAGHVTQGVEEQDVCQSIAEPTQECEEFKRNDMHAGNMLEGHEHLTTQL